MVGNLRAIDSVGVPIFDNSFRWTVSIRKAEDRASIKRVISGITPDGGTQIAPALTEAYQRILPETAVYKHIVLLTDGISEEGDSMALTKEAIGRSCICLASASTCSGFGRIGGLYATCGRPIDKSALQAKPRPRLPC